MAIEQPGPPPGAAAGPEETQLVQARVPLEDAALAFSRRDASGRIPIVLVPDRTGRLFLPLLGAAGVVLAAGIVWIVLGGDWGLLLVAVVVAAALAAGAVFRAFQVQVPEGASALLGRGAASAGRWAAGRTSSLPGSPSPTWSRGGPSPSTSPPWRARPRTASWRRWTPW